MSERLTDEQLAAVVAGDWRFLPEAGIRLITLIDSLAAEVQQARARRCDRCVYGDDVIDNSVRCKNYVSEEGEGIWHRPDWSCADFTPRPDTNRPPSS